MSYQVGVACYATAADAGAAACAQYTPVTTMVENGAVIRTVSCSTADSTTGALKLQITSTPVDGSPSTTVFVSHPIAFADCMWPKFAEAGVVVFGMLLGIYCTVKAWNYVLDYLDSYRSAE